MKPIEVLYKAIDAVGNALGKNFGLAESIKKANQEALIGEETEKEAARKKELDATIQQLKDLKEKRAGYQLGINKIDDDAAKAAAEKAKKAAEDYKAYLDKRNEDYLKSQQDELAVLKKRLEDEALLLQQQRESQFSLDEAKRAKKFNDRLLDAELNSLNNKEDVDAQIALLEAKRQIELQNLELTNTERAIINKKYADQEDELKKKQAEEEKALELAKQNEILNFAQMSTQSHQALSDAFFAVKNRNLQKGSAAERKSAEQQFKINKALAIQSAVISGIQGVINALSAQSVVPEPFGTVLKVATAVGVGIAAAANIAKIASTKFDAGGGGGGGGSAALPSAPPIPSPPSISTQQNNTNQSTSFDETGKRIGGDNEKQMTPTIQVKATVGVDEVSSKTNRVETLEKQSTF
jgi:chromosome segregation ATPase